MSTKPSGSWNKALILSRLLPQKRKRELDAGSISVSYTHLDVYKRQPYAIPLDLLIRCVMECLPLQPYRAILNEVTGTLRWGYYYSFFSAGIQADNPLDRISTVAYTHLDVYKRQLLGF